RHGWPRSTSRCQHGDSHGACGRFGTPAGGLYARHGDARLSRGSSQSLNGSAQYPRISRDVSPLSADRRSVFARVRGRRPNRQVARYSVARGGGQRGAGTLTTPTRPRVAMIGLDGVGVEYLRASIAVFPTLSGARARGVWRRLLSPADLLPGCVWPTFYTGSAPGEHGIYHHLQWDARVMRLRRVTPAWLACEPFWCDFERRGLRVTVVDVPMSFPSRLDVGIEVANWGSHDQLGPLAIQPGALRAAFEGRFGVAHAMGAEIPVNKTRRELRSILKRLVNGAAQKAELIRWLCLRTEWDFLLAVFGETHRGGHILWPEEIDGLLPEGALRDVYAAVDKAVGQVLAALPRDTLVILFSLHGMGANTSQEHFVAPVVDRVNAHFIDGPH